MQTCLQGLINAVEALFPLSDHRFCVRHLWQNFTRAGHRGDVLKTSCGSVLEAQLLLLGKRACRR